MMDIKQNLISIGNFSKLTGIDRKTLIYYDNIDVLKPEYIADNGYRYYSLPQMDTACLVMTLRELNVSLDEIKTCIISRTPESMLTVLNKQRQVLQEKINSLQNTMATLDYHSKLIADYKDVSTDLIEVKYIDEEPVYFSEKYNEKNKSIIEIITGFYFKCRQECIGPGYTVGCCISKKNLLNQVFDIPKKLYYKDPLAKDRKPAGLYVIGYDRGHYGESAPLYKKLFNYIKEHNLEIRGDSYEEHLLNELCISDSSQYLIRIQIPIFPV